MAAICFGEQIGLPLMILCESVVQRKTLPPKVTAVGLLDRAIAHDFLRVLTADSRSTR